MGEWSERDVVVTGVTSPLGWEVSRLLHRSGARVHAWNRTVPLDTSIFRTCIPINLAESTPALAEGVAPHAIFHLAAAAGDRATVMQDPLSALSGFKMDMNVLAAAMTSPPSVFVYASSATVYPAARVPAEGGTSRLTASERYAAGPPYDPDSLFGWMKLTTERVLEQIESSGAFRCIPARLFTLYDGTTDRYGVIGKWVAQAIRGDALSVWGGAQMRSFTHVADAATGLVLAAERGGQFEGGLDIAGEDAMSIVRAAQLIAEAFGTSARTSVQDPNPTEARDQLADVGLLQSWGWRAAHTLEETIGQLPSKLS